MPARIAFMKALNRNVVLAFNPDGSIIEEGSMTSKQIRNGRRLDAL
jgi:hypothetical protein